jgi:hypothetical protein
VGPINSRTLADTKKRGLRHAQTPLLKTETVLERPAFMRRAPCLHRNLDA